ncbi:MAG: hypothetical protein WBC04_23385 [Candidatus Acidiferrales bacterium]
MKYLIAALWFLTATTAGAAPKPPQEVEHAPTVAQCQADQRLWLSKIEDADHGLDGVTYSTLGAWKHEMDECMEIDPPNHLQYYNTRSEADVAQHLRVERFIVRHNLWGQFIVEDTQGKR